MPAAPTSSDTPSHPFWPAWRDWLPAPLLINHRERARVVLGALLGLGVAAWLSRQALPPPVSLWLVAPIGASTVLVFVTPASPLAQPWAVLGGNVLSALVGIACARWVPDPVWAAALAPGLAIAVMLLTRCLHPPGGAAALLMALLGVRNPLVALWPVGLNSLLLVIAGLAWNNATGRRYPHPQVRATTTAPQAEAAFVEADLDAVLARYNQVLDLPRDDLGELVRQAAWQAQGRRLRALRCADVMTPDPLTVQFGTSLGEAWQQMREHDVKALPVVDRYGHVMGIVTRADFLRHADLAQHEGVAQRLRQLLVPTPGPHSDKAEVVGQIMTRRVRVASAERPLAELVPLFASGGHHHLPVVGPANKLLGILTQTDVVAALLREPVDGPSP
jgi:CBS domain-containing membrane protein